jgi:predicted oxidoreductase
MRYHLLNDELKISELGFGCMRIGNLDDDSAYRLLDTAINQGITLFDHADIYSAGESERVFGRILKRKPYLRDQMIIQSKCGIRPGICYDWSKDYILSSVDGILNRLQIDYLDILLLHRPDALFEPDEVAEAFTILRDSGKVRYFGVSNENSMQIEMLNSYCNHSIVINQIQYSIAHCPSIDFSFNVNMMSEESVNREGSVIEYCKLKNIQLEAWSPLQYGMFKGTFIDNPEFQTLNDKIRELSIKYNVSSNAIAISWILRHPSGIIPVIGTTNVDRLAGTCKATEIRLTREEWYSLYLAAGKKLP